MLLVFCGAMVAIAADRSAESWEREDLLSLEDLGVRCSWCHCE
jgi:hypothetical protein